MTALKTIPLTRGKVTLVDDEDFEALSRFRWHAESHRNDRWYAARHGPRHHPASGKKIYMHRIILGEPAGFLVDHRDLDGLNNCRSNLRLASNKQNLANARPQRGRSSAHKGVAWYKRDARWIAYITVDGKARHLGYFDREEDAAKAYSDAAKELFGEFARDITAPPPS